MTEVSVVGSGPNGLAAAVILARAGLSVTVYERNATLGGGARTSADVVPGFLHDVCSAVHPMAFSSRFFTDFHLTERVPFVVPELSFAHPLDGGRGAAVYRDSARTAEGLGTDGDAWMRFFGPLISRLGGVTSLTEGALLRKPADLAAAVAMAARTLESGTALGSLRFAGDAAPAAIRGVEAHAILPLPSLAAAAVGVVLATLGQTSGWPIPVGGSQSIVDAMAADLEQHGGTIRTGVEVTSLRELPRASATVFDTTPTAMDAIVGDAFPARYRRALSRFRYGNAATKVDFTLSAPVPWQRAEFAGAGTLHLGGTAAEIAAAERDVLRGRLSENPYVLVSQPSTFDPTRAPAGKHTLWTYTHVPSGSSADRTEAVTSQIERFAPGFRDVIETSVAVPATRLAQYNPNYVGGDIAAGIADLGQLLRRPVLSPEPWRTPLPGVYLASASTPPGPGVHGMGGWNAARLVLAQLGARELPDLAPRAE